MNASQIFQWLLNQKTTYHQKFAQSQERINPELEKLAPLAQFELLYNCLGQVIINSLLDGKGVNVQYLGAFCFEIQQESEKQKLKKIKESIMNRPKDKIKCKLLIIIIIIKIFKINIYSLHSIKISANKLFQTIDRKLIVQECKSQTSVYQVGYEMQFCSYYMLASVCSFKIDVVNQILEAFFKAIIELTSRGESLALDFKFCSILIQNKSLDYYYDQNLQKEMNKLSLPELECLKSQKLGCDIWKSNLDTGANKAASIYHSIPPQLYSQAFKEKIPNPKKISVQTKKIEEGSKDLTGISSQPKFIYK